MPQASSNIITVPSRRSLLACGAAALIPVSAAHPPPAIDPIFKAIARHQRAEDYLEKRLNEAGCDLDRAQWRRLRKPVDVACAELVATVPTTPGGVAALLWYVSQNQRIDASLSADPVVRLIRRRASAAFAQVGIA